MADLYNEDVFKNLTLVLSTRNFTHLGQIEVEGLSISKNLNSADELSCSIKKTEFNTYLWDDITYLKLLWVKELNEYFEIEVDITDSVDIEKKITGKSLCEAELSQTMLYTIEINTEADIAREEYNADFPTLFYRDIDITLPNLKKELDEAIEDRDYWKDRMRYWSENGYYEFDTDGLEKARDEEIYEEKISKVKELERKYEALKDDDKEVLKNASLLHRILDKVPHYTIDQSKMSKSLIDLPLIRSFSIDGTSVYDFLTGDCADQYEVMFQFDSATRTVWAKDLKVVCNKCGLRHDNYDRCPDCYAKAESIAKKEAKPIDYIPDLTYFGEDTTIYVDKENLTEAVDYTTDVGSIKNCFKLVGGDDDMTAAVMNANPTGSAYVYYLSNEQKKDMPSGLVDAIDTYNKKVDSYKIESQYIGERMYECYDHILYYTSSMMPTLDLKVGSTAEEEAKKLAGMTYLALTTLSSYSQKSVESSLKNYAKTFIKSGYFKVTVASGDFKYYEDSKTATWSGTFTVTNYSDPDDKAEYEASNIYIDTNYEEFITQKIKKYIETKDDDDWTLNEVLKIEDPNKVKIEIQRYSLNRLISFRDAYQGIIDILVELQEGSPTKKDKDGNTSGASVITHYTKEGAGKDIEGSIVVDNSNFNEIKNHLYPISSQATLAIGDYVIKVDENVYDKFYHPYWLKLQACENEIVNRTRMIDGWETNGVKKNDDGTYYYIVDGPDYRSESFNEPAVKIGSGKEDDIISVEEANKYYPTLNTMAVTLSNVWYYDGIYYTWPIAGQSWKVTGYEPDARKYPEKYVYYLDIKDKFPIPKVGDTLARVYIGTNVYEYVFVHQLPSGNILKPQGSSLVRVIGGMEDFSSADAKEKNKNISDGDWVIRSKGVWVKTNELDSDAVIVTNKNIFEISRTCYDVSVGDYVKLIDEDGLEVRINRKTEIATELDFRTNLENATPSGVTPNYFEQFCAYRREDTYQNDNYISDGLDNNQIFIRAKEFYDIAMKDIVKSGEAQHSISTNLYNLLSIKEFEPLVEKFELGNWIRVKCENDIYRMRLIGYTVNTDDLSRLDVEFSDMTKTADGYNDIQSILSQASSMSTSYSHTQKQAEQLSEQVIEIADGVLDNKKRALESALYNIQNNNQEIVTIDSNGVMCKTPDDDNEEDFSPEQLRLTHNVLAFTDDNWETVRTALGKQKVKIKQKDGSYIEEERYGLSADFFVGDYVEGANISGGTIDGARITGSNISGGTISINDKLNLKYIKDGKEVLDYNVIDQVNHYIKYYESEPSKNLSPQNPYTYRIKDEGTTHCLSIGYDNGNPDPYSSDVPAVTYMNGMVQTPILHATKLSCDTLSLADVADTDKSGNGKIMAPYGLFSKGVIAKNIATPGDKNKIVTTEDYGVRKLYSYETASPYFGDIGESIISDVGSVFIPLEEIFKQTVEYNEAYQVFLQQYGKGECWVSNRTSEGFTVEGTPGLSFSWEVKFIQKDNLNKRLGIYED